MSAGGTINVADVLTETLADGATIATITPTQDCVIRGTCKFTAAARLGLTQGTDAIGYLNNGDSLVADSPINFAFEAKQGRAYVLSIEDDGANVTLCASEAHGAVL